MSVELEDAKTKVAQFQKQCEEYLVVIVQQKREADEQQKVTNISPVCHFYIQIDWTRYFTIHAIWEFRHVNFPEKVWIQTVC